MHLFCWWCDCVRQTNVTKNAGVLIQYNHMVTRRKSIDLWRLICQLYIWTLGLNRVLTTCFPGIDFSRDESRVSGFVNTPIRCWYCYNSQLLSTKLQKNKQSKLISAGVVRNLCTYLNEAYIFVWSRMRSLVDQFGVKSHSCFFTNFQLYTY